MNIELSKDEIDMLILALKDRISVGEAYIDEGFDAVTLSVQNARDLLARMQKLTKG